LNPKAGETVTLLDIDGPGAIRHICMVSGDVAIHGRSSVLRFYWDHEASPSVEVPVSDFFGVGHGKFAPVRSATVVVNPASAFNCYWPMPFRRHARITLTNQSDTDMGLLAYQMTYEESEVPVNAGYFHAQYRRALTSEKIHTSFWTECRVPDSVLGPSWRSLSWKTSGLAKVK